MSPYRIKSDTSRRHASEAKRVEVTTDLPPDLTLSIEYREEPDGRVTEVTTLTGENAISLLMEFDTDHIHNLTSAMRDKAISDLDVITRERAFIDQVVNEFKAYQFVRPREDYAAFAIMYGMLSEDLGRGVGNHIARLIDRTSKTVTLHLKRARELGFLTRAGAGGAASRPTQQAYYIVAASVKYTLPDR